ncbi:MAG: class I SAM-dependent methyltransferase [Anaerolineae bacterium]
MRILTHLPPRTKVLDIGCNTGELGAQMKALRDCYVVGVERESYYYSLAAQRLDVVIIADVMNLPESLPPDGQFDVVVAADVLEHFPNPWRVAHLLSGYLRGGGRMIISVPNVANYALRLRLLAGRFDYNSTSILARGHLCFFTLSSAQDLLRGAGLTIERVDVSPGLFVLPLYHATIERVFGRWKWYRRLEYLITLAFKNLFAFQFIVVARKDG